jgi:hypothetical protein
MAVLPDNVDRLAQEHPGVLKITLGRLSPRFCAPVGDLDGGLLGDKF